MSFFEPPAAPEGDMVESSASGIGSSMWDVEQWVWPLPPPGPFAFVCEWPGRGIAVSRTEIDAGLVLQTADRAVTLWPDDHGPRRS